MTQKAKDFMERNDKYGVYSGAAIGNGESGCIYSLTDGSKWRLNLADFNALKPGYPKWNFEFGGVRDNG